MTRFLKFRKSDSDLKDEIKNKHKGKKRKENKSKR